MHGRQLELKAQLESRCLVLKFQALKAGTVNTDFNQGLTLFHFSGNPVPFLSLHSSAFRRNLSRFWHGNYPSYPTRSASVELKSRRACGSGLHLHRRTWKRVLVDLMVICEPVEKLAFSGQGRTYAVATSSTRISNPRLVS
jgi:hypothetical protein